jgi:hypothetical protein
MKPFAAILAAAALSAGATAGLLEILRPAAVQPPSAKRGAASPADTGATRSAGTAAADAEARPAADLVAALPSAGDALEVERILQLEARVADLERQLERRPVAVPESPAATEVAALDATDPESRRLVLDVMASEEARRAAEREAERAQERLDAYNRRAERIAETVGLNGKQSSQLIEIWLAEDVRRETARDTLRDVGRDGARDVFQSIADWKTQELTQRFGAATAAAIAEAEQSGNPRNRGGRAGRGAGGPGGF